MSKRIPLMLGRSLLRLCITLVLVLLFAFLPGIYHFEVDQFGSPIGLEVGFSNYFSLVKDYASDLLHGDIGTYRIWSSNQERKIVDDIFRFYAETLKIFLPGVLLGVVFGILAAGLASILRNRWKNGVEFLSFFLVAIPDFLLILLLQFLVIWIYKRTGVKIAAVATAGSSKALFLPILTLALFPFVYVFRTALHSFENVQAERYIQTAYAKGLGKWKVLWSHTFKNGLVPVLNNLPSILMFALSNLVIVEYMYNTHGLTLFLFTYGTLQVLAVSVFLMWVMVEALLLMNDLILKILRKHRGEAHA